MFGNAADCFGFLAAGCVLISTVAPSVRWIRVAALFCNVFLVTHRLMHELSPVLALHAISLPINLRRVLKHLFGHRPRETPRRVTRAEGGPQAWPPAARTASIPAQGREYRGRRPRFVALCRREARKIPLLTMRVMLPTEL